MNVIFKFVRLSQTLLMLRKFAVRDYRHKFHKLIVAFAKSYYYVQCQRFCLFGYYNRAAGQPLYNQKRLASAFSIELQ